MGSSIEFFPQKDSLIRYALLYFCLIIFFASEKSYSSEEKPETGSFSGSLKVKFLDGGKLVELEEDLTFTDTTGKEWTAQKGMTSDGASIPGVGWNIVGPPLRGPYVRSAVVHDQYCYSRTEPYEEVHRMFRDAMIADNVPTWKVTFIYGAVLWKGPKWDDATVANARKLFKQYYYDSERSLEECQREHIGSDCFKDSLVNYAHPPRENYATPNSSYAICGKSWCTWTELIEFEDQWIHENSAITASELTKDETLSLLEEAKRNSGDFEKIEKFITNQKND